MASVPLLSSSLDDDDPCSSFSWPVVKWWWQTTTNAGFLLVNLDFCRDAFKTSSCRRLLKQVDGQCFETSGWPMLLIPAEANALNTSGACNEFGRRPHLGRGGRRPPPLYALLVLKALASASIKSIGHPLVLKALAIHLFQKPPATTCFKSFPVH